MKAITAIACVILLPFCAFAQQKPASKSVTVNFKNAEGQDVGHAVLTPAAHGVRIKIEVKNLPPGEHSLHIHQFPKCDAPDFKTAGSHFNPSGMAHSDHAAMPAGDIPNFSLIVAADGTGHATVIAPNVTMGSEPTSVFSDGGTAIVIHAVSSNDPGSAPPRIACGVIAKSE
jgi:Cu-Zn family superoxide dismutase